MKFISHAEGYIEPDGAGGYGYVYQYKDHLGNVRLSYSDSNGDGVVDVSEIIEESNYYPFGLLHKGYNNITNGAENKHHLYVDRELEKSLDYNMYEMDWRHYDPALGRFNGIDIMAEDFAENTPYHYGYNNPIAFSDPTGLFSTYVNQGGVIIKHIDDNDPNIYLVTDEDNWDGSNEGLQIIGRERVGRQYVEGQHLYTSDLYQDVLNDPTSLPVSFKLQIELGEGNHNLVFWPAELLSGGTLLKVGSYLKYLNAIIKYKKLLKNSKFLKQMVKQLKKDGPKSIRKTYNKIKRRIREHKEKLPDLKYKSSVKREIRGWEKNVKELETFMRKHKIDF